MRLSPLLLLAAVPFSLVLAAPAPTKPAVKPKVAPKKPVKAPAKKPLTKEQVVDGLWKQSDVRFHAGDYPGAVALHRKIVALEPTDTESYSVASWLLWSLGKRDDAMVFIQKGLNANPKNAEMWDAAGQHYNLQKLPLKAETAFGKAVGLSGKKADRMLRRRYAHAAQDAGHLGKSAQIWRALVADFPSDAVHKNNLARVENLLSESQRGPTQSASLDAISLI